jgi:DNA-binding CsgD family transcriptional regulator
MHLQPYVVDALEVLAGLAADQEDDDQAIRLFAAASAARDRTGYARCVFGRDEEVEDLRARSDVFDNVWEEGAALSLGAAASYARRGRGERKRPTSGWDSLTPTEGQVADLVREGYTNAEIAERMFVSTRTVQAHLTRMYTKLGIKGRTELAALATEQRPSRR